MRKYGEKGGKEWENGKRKVFHIYNKQFIKFHIFFIKKYWGLTEGME